MASASATAFLTGTHKTFLIVNDKLPTPWNISGDDGPAGRHSLSIARGMPSR